MPTWSVDNNAVISPDAGTRLYPDQTPLHGYVDVRAGIDDPQSFLGWFDPNQPGDHPELYAPLHPYRVRVTVTDWNSAVVLARDVFQADGILDSAAATLPIPIDYHYAPGTRENLPTVDCENAQAPTSPDKNCVGEYWFRLRLSCESLCLTARFGQRWFCAGDRSAVSRDRGLWFRPAESSWERWRLLGLENSRREFVFHDRVAGRATAGWCWDVEGTAAVWVVRWLRAETGMTHGAVGRVAEQLGYGVESVRTWVRRVDVDGGARPGVSSGGFERV
jgi:hypothetical protein